MKIYFFENEKDFIHASVEYIISVCKKKKGKIHVALSGGLTPGPIYKSFAKRHDIQFGKLEIFEVDERYVDHADPNSNYKLIEETLIKPLNKRGQSASFHAFNTFLSIKECLKKYEEELESVDQFDLCILGIGRDGHIASLFPKVKALHEKKKKVAHTITSDFPVRDRLTLTFSPILSSKKILILVQGKEKRSIIEELRNGLKREDEFPSKKLLKHPNCIVHFLPF